MNVGEIEQREVITVEPDAGISAVAEAMFHEKIGSVVAEGDQLVGIVTDRDLVVELFAEDSEANLFNGEVPLGDITAADLMTADPLTINPDDEVPAAIAQMTDAITRRLPIVEVGRVIGILTLDDLLVHLAGEYHRLSANLEGITGVIHTESPSR